MPRVTLVDDDAKDIVGAGTKPRGALYSDQVAIARGARTAGRRCQERSGDSRHFEPDRGVFNGSQATQTDLPPKYPGPRDRVRCRLAVWRYIVVALMWLVPGRRMVKGLGAW